MAFRSSSPGRVELWPRSERRRGRAVRALRRPHTRRSWQGTDQCGHSAAGPGTSPARPPHSSSAALPLKKDKALTAKGTGFPGLKTRSWTGGWDNTGPANWRIPNSDQDRSRPGKPTRTLDPREAPVRLQLDPEQPLRTGSLAFLSYSPALAGRTGAEMKGPSIPARKLSSSASWPA